MNGTDGDLIQRYAATRNAECFAELVARYRDMVYSAVVRVVREPASAEDVTQECFLRLARSAASIRGSVAAWLHTVAVNASVDALRQERSRRRREEQAADMTTHDEDEASWDEIKHEVHQAIERLPEKLRGPLVLHFLAGRRQSEVASELGVAQSTVSRRIEQGVARLREHLKQAGVVVSVSGLAACLATQTAEAAPATLVAALGKLALAGVPSAPPSAGAVASVAARIAAASLKAKVAYVVTATVVGGVGVHQVVSSAGRSRAADSPPAVTEQTRVTTDTDLRTEAPQATERGNVPGAAAPDVPPSPSQPEKGPRDAAPPPPDGATTMAALPSEAPAQPPDDPAGRMEHLIAQLKAPEPDVRTGAGSGAGSEVMLTLVRSAEHREGLYHTVGATCTYETFLSERQQAAESQLPEVSTKLPVGPRSFDMGRFLWSGRRWRLEVMSLFSNGVGDWGFMGRFPPGDLGDKRRRFGPTMTEISDGERRYRVDYGRRRATIKDLSARDPSDSDIGHLLRLLSLHIGMGTPSGFLKRPGATVEGREEVNGIECYRVVEYRPEDEGGGYMLALWVAPDRGFAPVKFEDLWIVTGTPDGKRVVTEWRDHQEVRPGLWLPTRTIHYHYGYYGDDPGVWRRTTIVTVKSWTVDPPEEPGAFRPDIPLGTLVMDESGEPTRRYIEGESDKAFKLFDPKADPPRIDPKRAQPLKSGDLRENAWP